MKRTLQEGFTLIELLIVIALIAVLAGAVIIALNPARQFQQARDSERWSHVSVLANAIQQNIAENRGSWTCTAGSLPTTTTLPISSDAGGYNLCTCLVPNQLAAMPYDPSSGDYTSCTDYDSGYSITQSSSTSRVTISATPELASDISLTQ